MTPLNASPAGRALALGLLALATSAPPGCAPKAASGRVPEPPTVAVVPARRMTVPIVAEPIGTTTALQEVSIRARVRGFLKEVHFEEGGDVEAGQLLFVIDEEPFEAKLAEARARLAAAEATLKKARDSKVREIAAAQLALNQAVLGLNKLEEAREVSLNRRNANSQDDVDRAVATRKRGEAQVESDRAALEQARADYDSNILAAEAEVAGARAVVRDAEIDLGYCRMASPIDGRIGLLRVKAGNLVGPATSGGGGDYTELAVVRQLDPIGVDIPVASRYLDRAVPLIRQGLPVEVFRPGLDGEGARRFPGRATRIDNAIDPTTSTVLIRAEVANEGRALLPGEFVRVDTKVGEIADAVVVPEEAVVETQAGPTLYAVDGSGQVAVRSVRAGISHQGLRVIESGLEPGEPVIVRGLQLVRPGLAVKTRPAEAEGPEPGSSPGEAEAASP